MWIHNKNNSTIITCRIYPNSGRNQIDGVKSDQLCVRLSSPPVEGKANKSLIKFFSKLLKTAQSNISIIQGQKTRVKVVAIQDMTTQEFLSAIGIIQ
ncbi:MAG: YggU family protein [Deltaproteobacteria bacterium]|nr:YggU family protein [Deltaproteobacteria bacterium]